MPSLSPGQQVTTIRSERLLVTLSGTSAAGTRLVVGDGNLRVSLRQSLYVVDLPATGAAEGSIVLEPSRDGGRMSGALGVAIEAVPLRQTGELTTRISPQRWDVVGVEVEGRSSLPLVSLTRNDDLTWTMTSLVTRSVPPPPPLDPDGGGGTDGMLRQAQHRWGDRSAFSGEVLFAVDRSASMAWTFREAGLLTDIVAGGRAGAAAAARNQRSSAWCTYGSVKERRQRIRSGGGETEQEIVQSLRPELFSSGSRPPLSPDDHLAPHTHLVLITDELPTGNGTSWGRLPETVSVIWVGNADSDSELPEHQRASLAALAVSGVSVLTLDEGSAEGSGRPDSNAAATVADWLIGVLAGRADADGGSPRATDF